MFGHSDDEKELPDDYLLTPYDYEGELREAFGEYWDAVMEYNQVSQLTQELSDRISEMGKKGWDFDHDGLRDWDEFHVYHTDPNKASTAGDLFSDSYKVNHEMDLFTYQEMDWIKADDRLSFKKTAGHPISNDTIYYAYEENYWDEEGLDLLDMSMEFGGEVKLTLTRDISNLEVEVFNTWDLTHTPIETIIDGNTLSFHVDLGYNYYLIYEKGYVIQTLSD